MKKALFIRLGLLMILFAVIVAFISTPNGEGVNSYTFEENGEISILPESNQGIFLKADDEVILQYATPTSCIGSIITPEIEIFIVPNQAGDVLVPVGTKIVAEDCEGLKVAVLQG